MGQKSSKAQQGALAPITVTFNGGLNYAESHTQIKDNELARAFNVIYDIETNTPETRPGTTCVTLLPITTETLTLDVAPATPWVAGDLITGATSLKSCRIVKVLTTKTFTVTLRTGDFTLGEILSNGTHTADQGAAHPTVSAATVQPILKLYYYEKSASVKYLVCAAGGALFYLNTNAWVYIGSLNSALVTPSIITYNTYMLVADGGTNLKKWDGSTFSQLTDGLNATAITEISARVVVNSSVDPDLVTLSGIEDETMWNTADVVNPAVGIRAGFGDNMLVNGFAVFGNDLIVSKKGYSIKMLYRINTSGSPTNWTVSKQTSQNCSQNEHTIAAAFNNIFFVDTNGFKSIKGVTEYGDLQVDLTGAKINSVLSRVTCQETTYVPLYSAIWMTTPDRIYAYHSLPSGPAFSELIFSQGVINSVTQANDIVYIAGNSGYLYKLDDAIDTDETSPSVTSNFPTLFITKRFPFFSGGILRKTDVEFRPLLTGTASNDTIYVRARLLDGSTILLTSASMLVAAQQLYDALGDLNDATIALGAYAGATWISSTRNRVRDLSIQWQIDSTAGRFSIEKLQAEIALVGG